MHATAATTSVKNLSKLNSWQFVNIVKNDIQLVRIYIVEAKSSTTDDRPGFLHIIQDSYKGLFDDVIVHELDRLSRDRYDSAFYKRHLKRTVCGSYRSWKTWMITPKVLSHS